MFNGYMYNLTNPMNEDIGLTMINRMYPSNIDPLTGLPQNYLPGVTMNPGQPMADSYVTPKQSREKAFLKTILAGAVLAGLTVLGLKKGGTVTKKVLTKITSPLSKLWSRLKGVKVSP